MSVWTTKSLGRAKEYVVLKHRLQDINGNILGVKFRNGYCVVEKNSKIYKQLKQLPLLKGQPELPITHLKKLKFITRTSDIKLIFGQDVYYQFLIEYAPVQEVEKQVRQEQEKEEHKNINNLCTHITVKGKLCKFEVYDKSPSKYCKFHILQDPKLEEVGIKLPSKMTKDEKKRIREFIFKKLENS